MHTLDASTARSHLGFERLVPALRNAFTSGAEVPPRQVHSLGGAGADSRGTVLVMPAWTDEFFGLKTINIFPGNRALGLPTLHATYLLYDARTGVPLAQVDGDEITALRTAGVSALAASFLAREDAHTLLVLGTGRIARRLPAAYRVVRPIERVLVWNHRLVGAQALASRWRDEGWKNAEAVERIEQAAAEADIIASATPSTRPLVRGEWLHAGQHLDLIGSFTPAMREADSACFGDGARVFTDTDEAALKAGDLLDAFAAGTLKRDALQGTLMQLCRAERAGRQSPGERTVFKAVGTALADLAAAVLAYRASTTRPPKPAA